MPYTLEDIIRTIDQWAFVGKPSGNQKPASGSDLHSYLALKGKLGSLRRTGAFDAPNVPPMRASELIQAGRVSVFDVSYANDRLKNLVIAQLLRSVFDYKRTNEKAAARKQARRFRRRERRSSRQGRQRTVRADPTATRAPPPGQTLGFLPFTNIILLYDNKQYDEILKRQSSGIHPPFDERNATRHDKLQLSGSRFDSAPALLRLHRSAPARTRQECSRPILRPARGGRVVCSLQDSHLFVKARAPRCTIR